MSTESAQRSATIYQFPPGGRKGISAEPSRLSGEERTLASPTSQAARGTTTQRSRSPNSPGSADELQDQEWEKGRSEKLRPF